MDSFRNGQHGASVVKHVVRALTRAEHGHATAPPLPITVASARGPPTITGPAVPQCALVSYPCSELIQTKCPTF